MGLLSDMFPEGEVKAIWVPSKLNVADLITRAAQDPIEIINSQFYKRGVLPSGEKMGDMIGKLIEFNTFVTSNNGIVKYSPVDDSALVDLCFYDQARRKQQIFRKTVGEDEAGTAPSAYKGHSVAGVHRVDDTVDSDWDGYQDTC